IDAAAFHLAQLPTHDAPLEDTYNDQPERQRYDARRKADHQPFSALYPILNGMYCALHAAIGYALCWWAGWSIWRRWRIDRLRGRDLLYGFLLYAFAGLIIWHGPCLRPPAQERADASDG